jgi:fatty acid desaturase
MTTATRPQEETLSALDERPAARAFDRDYELPSELRALVLEARVTSLWRSLAAALGDHLAIVAVLLGALLAYAALPLGAALAVDVVALVIAARFQRGLECLVHEASHFNWTRHHGRLNDGLADVLAALPCFSRVNGYRPPHMTHHTAKGAPTDPDRIRYEALAIEEVDRTSRIRFALGVARRLVPYASGWWRAIGTAPRTFVSGLAWQAVFVLAPAAAIGGLRLGLALSLQWLVAFFVVLPAIRFVAEAGEHRYTGTGTLLSSTINNDGIVHRLLFHPHNDGYHLTHHLWPTVPHHRLRWLHTRLTGLDPALAERVLRRTVLVQEPRPQEHRPGTSPGRFERRRDAA